MSRRCILTTSAPALDPRGEVTLSVGVKNTGKRAGDEVVQVYASYPSSKVARPARQLVGFERIALAAGESKSVSIPLAANRLAYWDAEHRAFVVEPGPVQLWAGGSSADAKIHTMLTVGESR